MLWSESTFLTLVTIACSLKSWFLSTARTLNKNFYDGPDDIFGSVKLVHSPLSNLWRYLKLWKGCAWAYSLYTVNIYFCLKQVKLCHNPRETSKTRNTSTFVIQAEALLPSFGQSSSAPVRVLRISIGNWKGICPRTSPTSFPPFRIQNEIGIFFPSIYRKSQKP